MVKEDAIVDGEFAGSLSLALLWWRGRIGRGRVCCRMTRTAGFRNDDEYEGEEDFYRENESNAGEEMLPL